MVILLALCDPVWSPHRGDGTGCGFSTLLPYPVREGVMTPTSTPGGTVLPSAPARPGRFTAIPAAPRPAGVNVHG
ncbi:hypothetical protein GJR88_04131 [Dietzia sp. DQ12-45-1b]|nr:hypothetical protein GJR88_04131 [Dietzia sp. DQ12-45-1b]